MSFTLMPFLYQTRTILRIPAHRASAGFVRSLHATARRTKGNTIPFDYELEQLNKDNSAAEVVDRGTITPTERQIFERIFADIEARGLKPAVKDDGGPVDSTTIRSTGLMTQQAAFGAGQARPATVTAPASLSGAAKGRARALRRFPPPLRGAAEKALDTINQQAKSTQYDTIAVERDEFIDDEWQAPAHTPTRIIELEAQRSSERTRIEGLITSATSDFELWDVLEREVFTMPARLGIVKNVTQSDEAEASPMAAERDHNTGDDVSGPGDSQKLSLYVHGPLYPAYLLLALRRLDTAFSAPSSLVFSILPRIKELGLESYVLGASTPFFNELLTIYWTRRGDISGMLNLLEEMQHCGLYFDRLTASIIKQVDETVSFLASEKERSEFGRALMLMPEYEHSQRDRVRYWHKEVNLAVQERLDDIGYMESTEMRG
ncbi:hypothetical protein FHL15_008543 [Xylaria flabelliformis]|uniref:Mtf2-like C-terminal domain-containing protein n=1 Tax=Xylaria flabelliformis TaxID=2512241 RepID=A0A553HRK4_9PEZI|nr:hypothetical protein FHL15_008543 [Xylaria flabelliformis]